MVTRKSAETQIRGYSGRNDMCKTDTIAQGRSEPDQPARACLKVIARDREGVRRALEANPGEPH